MAVRDGREVCVAVEEGGVAAQAVNVIMISMRIVR
jgi:hypothetical protein